MVLYIIKIKEEFEMADKKGKGVNLKVAGQSIDNVASKIGDAVDKVAGKKIKVDAYDIGEKIDKAAKNFEVDLDKLIKKK